MCLNKKREIDFPLTDGGIEADGLRVEAAFDPEIDMVTLRADGILNPRSSLHLAKQIGTAASETNCKKVLCDLTQVRFNESVLGIYEYPSRLQHCGVPRALRIAVVFGKDEQKYRFWETVSRNRGFMARVFRHTREAIDWVTDPSRY